MLDRPNVIIVGATDRDDHRWSQSNYGDAIDCVAPGVDMVTTERFGNYTTLPGRAGTSFAAPVVSGTLALIWSMDRTRPASEIENALKRSCLDLGTFGKDPTFGYGRVNLRRGLETSMTYRVVDIGGVPGFAGVEPGRINDAGQICGNVRVDSAPYPFSPKAAVRWNGPGMPALIPGIPGQTNIEATGINILGDVSGVTHDYDETVWLPWLWDGTSTHALQKLNVFPKCQTRGVNRDRVILGTESDAYSHSRAFVWPSWSSPPIELPRGGFESSTGIRIFDDGSIVGIVQNSAQDFRACIWSSPTSPPSLFTIVPGYTQASVSDGNSRNDFAGYVSFNGNPYPRAAIWVDGQNHLLQTPANLWSNANGINDDGVVVGDHGAPTSACIWENGIFRDVNTMVDPSTPGWQLRDIYQIDNNGTLFGEGLLNGQPRGFIAYPCVSGGQAGLTVNCSVVLSDYVGDDTQVGVTFELIREQTGTVEGIFTLTRDPDSGLYHLPVNTRGLFRIRAKGPHWLARRIDDVALLDQGTVGANFTLINGDLDDSNMIDSDDFDMLVASFGIASAGDLNGDDATDSDDFDILVAHFGFSGDW